MKKAFLVLAPAVAVLAAPALHAKPATITATLAGAAAHYMAAGPNEIDEDDAGEDRAKKGETA